VIQNFSVSVLFSRRNLFQQQIATSRGVSSELTSAQHPGMGSSKSHLSFALKCLSLLLHLAGGAVYNGVVDSRASWQFLNRFCFNPTPESVQVTDVEALKLYGLFSYTVYYKIGDKPSLMIYYDGFDSWHKVTGADLTCEERRNISTAEVHLWKRQGALIDAVKNDVSNYQIKVQGLVIFRSAVPVYFFVAAANCPTGCHSAFCEAPVQIQYNIKFTNGKQLFKEQFSCDEQGIMELRILFLIAYAFLSFVGVSIAYNLAKENKFHHTVRLLMYSIDLKLVGQICHLIDLSRYAHSGIGIAGFMVCGYMLEIVSEVMLVLLLIVLAKGWTIYRRKISASGRVKIAIYFTFFLVVSCIARAFSVAKFDPSRVVYYYESAPGKFLIAMWFLIWVWFLHASAMTFKDNKRKRRFYIKFCTLYGLWFLLIPLLLIASITVDDSRRARFSVAWELIAFFIAHLSLLAMYNPNTSCNKTFPFHANTSDMLGITKPGRNARGELQIVRQMPQAESQRALMPEQNGYDTPTGHCTNQHLIASSLAALENTEDMFEEVARLLGSSDPFWILRDSGTRLHKGLTSVAPQAKELRTALMDFEEDDRDVDLPDEEETHMKTR